MIYEAGNREYQAQRTDPRSMRHTKSGLVRSLAGEIYSSNDAMALADEMGGSPRSWQITAEYLRDPGGGQKACPFSGMYHCDLLEDQS